MLVAFEPVQNSFCIGLLLNHKLELNLRQYKNNFILLTKKGRLTGASLSGEMFLKISPFFQNNFTLLFEHYIERICKFADLKNILYRCNTFEIILC